jgi:hypothetical protein
MSSGGIKVAVDPGKTRKILVVHGVQTGDDKDLNQDKDIEALVIDRLNGIPVDFKAEMYRYENINDEAQKLYRSVIKLFIDNIIAKKAVDLTADLVGDVLIALNDGSTAQKIRQGLVNKILEIYEEGNPLYIVAHSLGTIYAFDAINQLIEKNGHFDRNSRKTWPVQAMVTMGSPIGLSMFGRNSIKEFGQGRHFFRWINYWDRTDPVVTSSFYGKPQQGYDIVEKFSSDTDKTGWFIQDKVVDVGRSWLLAHVGYWNHPGVGDDLAALITS